MISGGKSDEKICVLYLCLAKFHLVDEATERFCSVVVITPDFDFFSNYSGNPSSNLGKTSYKFILRFCDFEVRLSGFLWLVAGHKH